MSSGEEPNPPITAMQLLMRLQGGQFLHDLEQSLAAVNDAVIATGKAGSISIEIGVDIVKNAPSAVIFKTKLKEKVPKPAPQTDILFVGDQGALHTNNPRQREIKFGPRPAPSAVPPNVDPSTGEIRSTSSLAS